MIETTLPISASIADMRFQQLPTEIILQILDHLTSRSPEDLFNCDSSTLEASLRDYQQTLAVLSLTCKHFHHLLQPLLYRTYHKPSNIITLPFREYKPAFTLRKYLSTLLKRPDLASKLQTLRLGAWETRQTLNDQQPSLTPQKRPSGEQKDLYRKHAKIHPFPIALSSDLRSGYEDAEIALLLSLIPSLTTLTIELQPFLPTDHHTQNHSQTHHFQTILQESLRGPSSLIHSFPNLTTLTIRTPEKSSSYGITLPSIQSFLLLPSLHSLTLEDSNQAPSDLEAFTLFPRSSGVKELLLKRCRLDAPALAALLGVFKGLERVGVEVKRDRAFGHLRPSSAFSTAVMGWRGLVSALGRQGDTLVELEVYADGDSELMRGLELQAGGGSGVSDGRGEGGGGGVLGPVVKKFITLRTLTVQEIVLLGGSPSSPLSSSSTSFYPPQAGLDGGVDYPPLSISDILPPALQTLTITDCHIERRLVEFLEAVLDSVAAAESGVESINLQFGRTCKTDEGRRREWNARFGSVITRLRELGVVVLSDGAAGRGWMAEEKKMMLRV